MNGELVEERQYWDRYWVKSVDLPFLGLAWERGLGCTGAPSVAAGEETDSFNQSVA